MSDKPSIHSAFCQLPDSLRAHPGVKALMHQARELEAKVLRWKPIETAPRDGTVVLLRGGKTTEDFYTRNGDERYQDRPVTAFFRDGDWLLCFWGGAWRDGYDNPTHWMPLPSPATTKE